MMESTMDYPPVVSMNTPIKKIRNLTLNSPPSRTHHHSENKHNRTSSFTSSANGTGNTEALYPTMDDIQTSPTASTMLQKGYSQRLTHNVLAELNSRAQEISQCMGSPTSRGQSHNQNHLHQQPSQSQNMSSGSTNQVMNRRNKRYSGIHFSKFKQMESINSHYSVHMKTPSPQKTDMGTSSTSSSSTSMHGRSASRDSIQHNHRGLEESASKRRRTLNGNDEVVAIPIIQKKDTIKEANSSSPTRKISPSKGSRNLNSMLRQTTETGSPNKEDFIKPYPPSFKLRPSSLEMAGVLSPPSQHQHHQQQLDQSRFVKPMAPSLQKKSSIPTLNKKSSIPNLNKAPSIPSLQKKSSIPTLNRKSSIPTLQKKSSMSSLNKSFGAPSSPPPPLPHHQMSTLEKKPSIPQFYNNGSRNTPHLSRVSPSRSIPTSASTKSVNSRVLYNSTNQHHTNNNTLPKSKSVTIPQPFSLYDKPTISSSQKSLNKFQKFKDKFT